MKQLPSTEFGRRMLASTHGIFYDDFLDSGNTSLVGGKWNVTLNSGQYALVAGSAQHPGCKQFSTLASNVAAPIIYLYQSGMVFGGGDAYECEWLIQSPSALSDGTDTYTIFAGFGDTSTGALSVDAAYLKYTHSLNSGRWTGFTSSNSVENQMTSAAVATVATSTWYSLKTKVNAAGTRVDFYVNNVFIGYSDAQIPTGTARALTAMLQIVKSAGTNPRTFLVDEFVMDIKMPQRF